MKKLLFIALSAMFCLSVNAQDIMDEVDDFVEVTDSDVVDAVPRGDASQYIQPNMLSMVQEFTPAMDNKPLEEQLYPLGKGLFGKHLVEQAIELCPSVTKNKISQSDMQVGKIPEDIDDTGLGLNFGYSLIFVPGHEENGQLRLNKFGFAYSLGFVTSFTISDRYGTTCDFLGKIGLETCHTRKMGIGLDFLLGYGKSPGNFFTFNDIVEDKEPTGVKPYTEWGLKYGGQLWLKTGLMGGASSHTDVLLFARLIMAPNPNDIQEYSKYSYNLWKKESWGFGVIRRYRM